MLNRKPKFAVIGGGTGLSTLLKGLRYRTQDITAIVSVADDGGSSGKLRQEYNILPPGDIRNCISALADEGYQLGEFLNYRFEEGSLAGHAMGNLILTALDGMCSHDFESAVSMACDIFNTHGRVVPVSAEDITLNAVLSNGERLVGESAIGMPKADGVRIEKVFLSPERPKATESAVRAILGADVIIMGPGSLYTSIIPNFLVDGITDSIKKSEAKKIYICNIMTEPGETDDYTAYGHLEAIERYTYKGMIDCVIANCQEIPGDLLEKYAVSGAYPVVVDEHRFSGRQLVKARMMMVKEEYVRHNFSRLARAVMMCGF